MNNEFSETELVQGILAHDNATLKYLYRQFFPIVKSYVAQNSGNEDEAKDIFQDGIIAVWNNVHNGKYESRADKGLGPYLVKVCKFRWLEQTKSARHKKTANWDADWEKADGDNKLDAMIKKEQINYAVKLVSQLGEKCRNILTMFYYEKKNMQEIAAANNLTAESAKNEKYRCMQQLKKMHTAHPTTIL